MRDPMSGPTPVDLKDLVPPRLPETADAALLSCLERIAAALERLGDLQQPAYDINVIQLEMLKAQTRGGIVAATLVPPTGGKQH